MHQCTLLFSSLLQIGRCDRDRHPNDVVYSICANRQQKRVSVVFRGTVNSHNWLMNLKFNQTDQ